MSTRTFAGDPARLVLLAPIVFALHVVEEAPGFVAWFNSLVPARPITDDLFYTVNAVAFVITVAVAGVLAATREAGAVLGALAWISFLMLANGLFHGRASVPAVLDVVRPSNDSALFDRDGAGRDGHHPRDGAHARAWISHRLHSQSAVLRRPP